MLFDTVIRHDVAMLCFICLGIPYKSCFLHVKHLNMSWRFTAGRVMIPNIKPGFITKAVKIKKYEIHHTCDIESHRWFYQLFVVRVITQILSTDNSFHIVPVYDKTVPGCDKHRINHI